MNGHAERVLVAGGAGFIGSHLVEALLGWSPTVPLEQGLATTIAWFAREIRAPAAPPRAADGRPLRAAEPALARQAP